MSEDRPANHGKKWSIHDRNRIFELHKHGHSFSEIAREFERTPASIELQLREIFIQNNITRRNIKHLKHFTDKRNLPSIQKYGILPIEKIIDRKIEHYSNDDQRLDKFKHGSCFSITNINKYLLNSYKSRFPEREWIEIVVDAEILCKSRCFYFSSNAAKNVFTTLRDDYDLCTPKAFEAMFAQSIPSSPFASRAGKALNETTCVQAEVIILGTIAKSRILSWNPL